MRSYGLERSPIGADRPTRSDLSAVTEAMDVTMMEWVLTLTSSFVVLFLLAPLVVMLGALVLFALVGHVFGSGPVVSKTSFDCPFSTHHATVEFVSDLGIDRPTDVMSCSVFDPKPYHVRCKKECIGLAKMGSALSPMMPRYSLLSGGVAYRAATVERHDGAEAAKVSVA